MYIVRPSLRAMLAPGHGAMPMGGACSIGSISRTSMLMWSCDTFSGDSSSMSCIPFEWCDVPWCRTGTGPPGVGGPAQVPSGLGLGLVRVVLLEMRGHVVRNAHVRLPLRRRELGRLRGGWSRGVVGEQCALERSVLLREVHHLVGDDRDERAERNAVERDVAVTAAGGPGQVGRAGDDADGRGEEVDRVLEVDLV